MSFGERKVTTEIACMLPCNYYRCTSWNRRRLRHWGAHPAAESKETYAEIWVAAPNWCQVVRIVGEAIVIWLITRDYARRNSSPASEPNVSHKLRLVSVSMCNNLKRSSLLLGLPGAIKWLDTPISGKAQWFFATS